MLPSEIFVVTSRFQPNRHENSRPNGASSAAIEKRFVELDFNVVVNFRRCLSASRSLLSITLVNSDIGEPRLPPDARDRVGSPSDGGRLINNVAIFISKPCTDYKAEDFTSLSQAAHLSIDGLIRVPYLDSISITELETRPKHLL
jgi:hypothetical protein